MRPTPLPAPRIYPNLVQAVADGLAEVFNQEYYADKVVSHLLKRDKRWGSRDRGFIAETLYDCVRHWRLFTELAQDERPKAIISAYWTWKYYKPFELDGFPALDAADVAQRLDELASRPEVLHSFPDWMNELGHVELPKRWPALMPALNQPAQVFLRVNTLKTDRESLLANLSTEGLSVEADERGPLAIRVLNRRNLWSLPAFKAGHFEVQDIASQQIVPLLDLSPGMTVVDACAGAGGKTLQIAAELKNKGRVIAMDVSARKLQELKRRAKRAGISNVEVREITSSKTIKRLAGKADRVLLDVPCSGLGVLRRNPDAKWKLQLRFLNEVRAWQSDILERYVVLAKATGKVVYATCSILPSESEEQVAKFLSGHADWRVEEERRYWPTDGYDGFYAASLTEG